ncbi:MAG: hypothetical protein HC919_11625 [Oscillatoriales cyanobacterium SM2_2_1]|nr:hypothetical protein [Oscillatoriales cyanobacterium SM2_2_1]
MNFTNVSALLALSFVFAPAVLAQSTTTTVTGQNGDTATTNVTRIRDGNLVNVNRNTTFGNGTTTSSQRSTTINPDGSYSSAIQRTNRAGQTTPYRVNGQYSRTGNTITRTGTVTNGTTGQQGTFDKTRTCVSGTCTGTRIYTGAQGRTRTETFTSTRTAPGQRTGTVNVTRRNGSTNQVTFQTSRTRTR